MSNTVKLPTCPKCGLPIPKEAPQGLCPKCVLLVAATATEQGVPATATSEIPSIERISKAFPQFEILELIGRGGMGFVFKARQPHLDRFVALKLLPDKLAKDALFAERFNREGRVLARLNHPNIVSVYDFGVTGGFCFLLMEYVDGVNLRQAMKAGRFSPAEALALVPKVCEALQYAHEQGILHRDIKPENILLDAKGRVKIADFGIAKLVGEEQPNITLTNTGAALGTPHYMAPEQLEKPATVDHRADIYSLGVVFYEMLTGELPIGRFAAPSSKTPVNATVDDVVFRTLEKDRERRFQSAGEMKTQVEHLGAGSVEQPEVEEDDDDEAPRSWLEVIYSMRLAGWFFAALCLVDFASPHVTRLGNSPASTFTLGLSRPWLVNVPLVDAHDVVTREWRFNPSSTSFGAGILGLALVAALLVLRHRVRTTPAVPRGAGRISKWSICGAISVGLSLSLPLFSLACAALLRNSPGVDDLPWAVQLLRKPITMLLISALPALAGTILGWMALSEIRESSGRVRGLALAMFATLFWPLLIFGTVTVGAPMTLVAQFLTPTSADTIGRLLSVLLPAAVGAFSFWVIHATARWATQEPVAGQRGLLKWVFIVVLISGVGVVLTHDFRMGKRAWVDAIAQWAVSGHAGNSPSGAQPGDESGHCMRVAFRGGELATNAQGLWLALNYYEESYGSCEKYWKSSVTGLYGFATQTVETDLPPDANHDFEAPTSRVMFRLPDGFDHEANAGELRRFKAFRNTTIKALPGHEYDVFNFRMGERGLIKVVMGIRSTNATANGAAGIAQAGVPDWANERRKLLLQIPNLENDTYHSLMVTTDSEFPVGDYLVGLLQRPDGRIEEHPANVTVYSGAGRDREMRSVLWSMGEFGSNRVREFAAGMRASLDGRVIEVASDQRVPIFSVTNDRGATVAGFLALRSHRLPDTDSPSVFVSIIDTPQHWVSFLSVQLRVSAPPGHMPLAVGVLADGSELETHTSISGGGRDDAGCYWYLPQEFQAADVQEVIRQIVATRATFPNGIAIPTGQRVPVFSVTNQSGTVFSGYFEMKKATARTSSSASVKFGTAITATKAPAKPAGTPNPSRRIQFRTYENDKYQSLSVTSDSELPPGEYLVGLWQRPDGRMEERPATTTIYGGGGPTRVHKHLLWTMSQFNSNRVREFAADLKAAIDGRVIELLPDQNVPVFSVTNDQGGTVSGFVALRSHALPAADEPAATIMVTEASVASQFFLSASLRIAAPPGYLPNAVGLMGDGSELNTHTSIFGGRMVGASARDSCYWYYPKNFQTSDVQEIVRQILASKVTHPNGIKIRPGERVPMFAVTNQAGTIFRGFFQLPAIHETK